MAVLSKSFRVLVVDDEPITAIAITDYLIAHNFNAHAVHSVRAALAEIERHMPDIILLDLVMPIEGGMELLAILRQNPEMQSLPVIVTSAVKDSEAIVGALRAGASDYVSKPVDLAVLLARVERHLALAEAMANLERLAILSKQISSENQPGRHSAQRRQAVELLELEVHRAHRHGNSLAVLAVQLDQFDAVFARHGQEDAENLLRQFVDNMSGILRRCDRLCQTAAHVFLIILPQTEEFTVDDIARQIIEQNTGSGHGLMTGHNSTVSIGIVNVREHSEIGARELFTNALEAMQEAKSRGGNQCYYWTLPEQAVLH